MTNNGTTHILGNQVNCKCNGCTKRYVGCHSKCEDYKEFQKHNEIMRKKKKYTYTEQTGWNYYRGDKDKSRYKH